MLPPSGTPTLTRHPQLLLQLTATPAARAAHTRSTANSSSVHYSSSSSSCRSQQQQPRLVASASQQQYHNTFEGSGSSSSCHLVPQLRPKLLLTRGHYRQQHLLWCSSSSNSSSVNSSQGGSMGKASTALSKRLHAYVSGNVQGVFFRSYTKAKAVELGVTGWVRNRRDGRVEVMAEGYESDLQQLLTWLHTGSPQADVSGVEASWSAATGEFDDFGSLWTV